MAERRKKTSSKAVFIFVVGSIIALLAIAWMYRPPFRKRGAPQPGAAAPQR